MPQQINLCTPILLTQKRYFSAQTMVQALAVFVLLGGGLCVYWVWSLNVASEAFKKSFSSQSRELESLQLAIAKNKASAGPVELALTQDLQVQRSELMQREKMLEGLQRGLFRTGWGHAARLQLVAQSIPAQVWVTEVKADEAQLEISGFTLEPSELNDWVDRLAASPLLEGQRLSTVKVEHANAPALTAVVGGATASTLPSASSVAPASRPVWSFNLVSALGKPSAISESKP